MQMVPQSVIDNDLNESMQAWRRDIHAYPELAFEEQRTADVVARRLAEASPDMEIVTGIGGTGVVGTLRNGDGKRAIGLRADLDALPLQEENTFAHRSKHDGVMHACGHDGHTAMLLGAAHHLAKHRDGWSGSVRFIFQPAEEGLAGGRAMVEDGLFDRFPVDAVFGLHNWPGLEAGTIAVQPGPVMAAYDNFEITITGRGGHAAMPHQTVDPVVVAAQLINALQTIVSRGDPLESAVVSVTQVHGGTAFNVIPGEVSLKGTVRTLQPAVRERTEAELRRIVSGTCAAAGASAEIVYRRVYPPTINSAEEARFAAETVAAAFGEERLVRDYPPSMGSEDFAFMLEARPGCYVKLGAGDRPGLHHPRFDFNDEILSTGAAYWVALTQRYLAV